MFELAILFILGWTIILSDDVLLYHPLFYIALVLLIPGIRAMLKGAPFVPSNRRVMKKMMTFADVKSGQTVVDFGCGDGRLVFAAAKRGAKAIGYELSIPTFLLAKFLSLFVPRASIYYRDAWKQDYSDCDVVFCFLLIETMKDFEKKIWPTLKPGCKVVSHAFRFGDIEPTKRDGNVYLYMK